MCHLRQSQFILIIISCLLLNVTTTATTTIDITTAALKNGKTTPLDVVAIAGASPTVGRSIVIPGKYHAYTQHAQQPKKLHVSAIAAQKPLSQQQASKQQQKHYQQQQQQQRQQRVDAVKPVAVPSSKLNPIRNWFGIFNRNNAQATAAAATAHDTATTTCNCRYVHTIAMCVCVCARVRAVINTLSSIYLNGIILCMHVCVSAYMAQVNRQAKQATCQHLFIPTLANWQLTLASCFMLASCRKSSILFCCCCIFLYYRHHQVISIIIILNAISCTTALSLSFLSTALCCTCNITVTRFKCQCTTSIVQMCMLRYTYVFTYLLLKQRHYSLAARKRISDITS